MEKREIRSFLKNHRFMEISSARIVSMAAHGPVCERLTWVAGYGKIAGTLYNGFFWEKRGEPPVFFRIGGV